MGWKKCSKQYIKFPYDGTGIHDQMHNVEFYNF